ncbi:hypothetical protein AURDEDRAFT_110095 [Auricularia subglabra TFB-10046 SS5]|nr:hypothetical protein AURDEDRAFT_110095 [Auricularia subglabra TFB-10046 SS5]
MDQDPPEDADAIDKTDASEPAGAVLVAMPNEPLDDHEPHDTDSDFDVPMTAEVQSLEDEPLDNGYAVEQLMRENANLQRTVASQQAQIVELRKQLQLANNQLATTEQRLVVVSQDLAASRAFVSKEDVDGQQIRRLFKDLNEGVDDQTFLLSEKLGDPPDDATLDANLARALIDSHRVVRQELSNFVYAALIAKMPLLDFVSFFLPAIFNAILLRVVFRPFIPGLDASRSAQLHACYADISAREPQDRAARWRSITYTQCCPNRNDDELVAQIVNTFYSILDASLPLILPDRANDVASLRSQFAGTTSKVVRDALKLQDLFMSTYISFDYRLIAPSINSRVVATQTDVAESLKRCPHTLQRLDPPSEGTIAVALLAFGLSASKSVQLQVNGQAPPVERSYRVMNKASVVAVTCRWAQAHSTDSP